jgi:chromosome segregation ATPase
MFYSEAGGVDSTALGAVVGAIIGAVGTQVVNLIITFYKVRREGKEEDRRLEGKVRKDAIAEWRQIVAEQRGQVERLQQTIREQGVAIDALKEDASDCMVENAEIRQALRYLNSWAKSARSRLVEMKQDPGEVPEIPEPKPRRHADTEFLTRQAEQTDRLTDRADEVLKRSMPKDEG